MTKRSTFKAGGLTIREETSQGVRTGLWMIDCLPGDQFPPTGTTEVETSISTEPVTAALSEIIGTINQPLHFDFTEGDRLAMAQWASDLMDASSVRPRARNNSFANLSMANVDVVMEKGFSRSERNPEVLAKLMAKREGQGNGSGRDPSVGIRAGAGIAL